MLDLVINRRLVLSMAQERGLAPLMSASWTGGMVRVGRLELTRPARQRIAADGGTRSSRGGLDIHTHSDDSRGTDTRAIVMARRYHTRRRQMWNSGVARSAGDRVVPNRLDGGVEGTSRSALAECIDWRWDIPEYLDVVESLPLALVSDTQVTHAAVRA